MVQAVVNAAMISMGRSPQRATERPPDVSFGRCRMRSTRRCKRGSEVVLNPQHFPSVLRHSPRCLQSALRALLLRKPSRLAALGISREPGNDKR